MDDLMILVDGAEPEAYYAALQRSINNGSVWSLEGTVGRGAMHAITEGLVMLGKERRQDYWGTEIPSRTDVADGTKGSRSYVVERHGERWATMLEAAEVPVEIKREA